MAEYTNLKGEKRKMNTKKEERDIKKRQIPGLNSSGICR